MSRPIQSNRQKNAANNNIIFVSGIYIVLHKNVPTNLCPYLRQMLTNLDNFFTDTLCGQFAIE